MSDSAILSICFVLIFTVKNFTMRLVKCLNNKSNLGFQDLVVIVGLCVKILKKAKLFDVFVILIVLFLCAGAPLN